MHSRYKGFFFIFNKRGFCLLEFLFDGTQKKKLYLISQVYKVKRKFIILDLLHLEVVKAFISIYSLAS